MQTVTRGVLHDVISGENRMATLNKVFGYKDELTYEDFYFAYKRMGIAHRIIGIHVDYTWRKLPLVKEAEDDAEEPKLKKIGSSATIEGIVDGLNEKFGLFNLFKRADTMACIGRYSIIVIGTKTGKMEEELEKGRGINDIAYFNAYSEDQAAIDKWETDTKSPRYGLPKIYKISVKGESGKKQGYRVHYSRVIHILDDADESDVYGTPKLEPVYSYLLDLYKVVGASSEIFWLMGNPGLVFNLDKDLMANDDALEAMEMSLEEYDNKLRRRIKTFGVDVQQLSSQVVSPQGNFDVLLQLISGSRGIPSRMLVGSEQGQLASSTDKDMFTSRIAGRQETFATDVVLRPLLDRLMEYGYIPTIEFEVEWEPLIERDTSEKIADGARIIQAVRQAVGTAGEVTDVLTIEEIREMLGLEPEMPESEHEPTGDYEKALSELPDDDHYQLAMKKNKRWWRRASKTS